MKNYKPFLTKNLIIIFSIIFLNCYVDLQGDSANIAKKIPIIPLSKKYPEIIVKKISQKPYIDGLAIDKSWYKLKTLKINYIDKNVINKKTNKDVKVKVCMSEGQIFFLLQYLSLKENRSQQSWHWNAKEKVYILGKEKEETFSIIITRTAYKFNFADIWTWRARRTDPVSKADDLFYFKNQFYYKKSKILFDAGVLAWFSKSFGNHAGNILPRFYNRTPHGSVSDVNAKASWEKGELTIEFARKLNTQQKDDISFKKQVYYIRLIRGALPLNFYKFPPTFKIIIK